MAQKVTLIHGESNFVPGRITKAAFTKEGADLAAAELVNLLLDEMGMPQDATPDNWDERRIAVRTLRAKQLRVEIDELTDSDSGDVWLQKNVDLYGDLKPAERP